MKTVLISPLDWGLGHATRLIPIVDYLLEKNHRVLLAGSGPSSELLKQRYPELPFFELPDYKLSYSRNVPLFIHLLKQIPRVYYAIHCERKRVNQICQREKVDLIINDNRFGVSAQNIPSAYMTHQLIVPAPNGFEFLEPIVSRMHYDFIKHHQYLLIPDWEKEPSLARRISHPKKRWKNIEYLYMGPLSRFKATSIKEKSEYKVLILLSGLEPHRSDWEKMLIKQLPSEYSPQEVALVRGLPHLKEIPEFIKHRVTAFNHLPADQLQKLIMSSENIVCRSGYSTLMDLLCLGKKALICPTPGQTEQAYLGDILPDGGNFISMKQKNFNLAKGIAELAHHPDPEPIHCEWKNVIEDLLKRV